MQANKILPYTYQIYSSIDEIDENLWNSFIQNLNFYQSYQFLKIIESTQNEINCKYCLIYDNDILVGLAYFQLIDFKLHKLTQYNSTIQSNFFIERLKNYFSQKTLKLLNLGNVFFTGDRGIIFNENEDIMQIIPELFEKVGASFNFKIHAYLTSNITLSDEKKCRNFPIHGFHHFDTEPDMLLNLDNNWKTINDYTNALSSKYRVRLKKILSTSSSIEKRKLDIDDIEKYHDEISILFDNVMKKATFHLAELNIDFFRSNLKYLSSIFEMYGYFLNDKMCGFSSFYICKGIIHVHYIGLDYDINYQYKLYNKMLIDVIQLAIENNIQKVHFGRTATEIKSTIGAKPIALNAYLKINNKIFNRFAPSVLKRIKIPEFIIREPFKS